MITGTAFSYDYSSRNSDKPLLWLDEKNRSENLFLHRELADLGFLANFAKEVGGSLNPDEVLKSAARLLYNHFHYSLAVFALAEGFGGVTGYSPLDPAGCRSSWLMAVKEYQEFKYRSISGHRFLGLAAPVTSMVNDTRPVVLELGDNIGTIKLYCSEEDAELAGHDLLAGVAASLTGAIRNAREHERVKELSLRDSLTGLYNRRVLEEILHLEENRRKPSHLSILILDVDDFKIINDTFGHPAGDQVLNAIGKLLSDNTRKENIVARYGGEEFALLLTNTGLDTALHIAERLRSKLGEQEFIFSGRKVRLSVSIGVAHNEGDALYKESLMSRADQALYQAKRSGKNRVCCHEPAHLARMAEKRRRPPVRVGASRFDGAITV
jgi:two-component system, cell cycle response regulator